MLKLNGAAKGVWRGHGVFRGCQTSSLGSSFCPIRVSLWQHQVKACLQVHLSLEHISGSSAEEPPLHNPSHKYPNAHILLKLIWPPCHRCCPNTCLQVLCPLLVFFFVLFSVIRGISYSGLNSINSSLKCPPSPTLPMKLTLTERCENNYSTIQLKKTSSLQIDLYLKD